MSNDKRYEKLIAKGVERYARELSCEIERGRDWYLAVDLAEGGTVWLTWNDVIRIANICDCEIYALAVANRLDEAQSWTAEHYQVLRRGLDGEQGEEYAAEVAKAIDSSRDRVVNIRDKRDLTDDFAAAAAIEA